MQEIVVSEQQLDRYNLLQLQGLADQVGVGYDRLNEEELRQKLRFEGAGT